MAPLQYHFCSQKPKFLEGANLANLDDLVVSLEGRLLGPLDGVVEGVGLDDQVSGNG